jgi:hypothetical protein
VINDIKLKEFDKDNLADAFVYHCIYIREFLLSLEKTPTSSLQMSDMIEAESLKKFALF